jgi:hypothetical protein
LGNLDKDGYRCIPAFESEYDCPSNAQPHLQNRF